MRDLTAVAKEGSHHWVPIQDLPFDEIILFAYAPEHDTQLPAATSPTAELPQTPDEEARDMLAKAISKPG